MNRCGKESSRYMYRREIRSIYKPHVFGATNLVTLRYTHTDIWREREKYRERNRVQQLRYGTKPNVK